MNKELKELIHEWNTEGRKTSELWFIIQNEYADKKTKHLMDLYVDHGEDLNIIIDNFINHHNGNTYTINPEEWTKGFWKGLENE